MTCHEHSASNELERYEPTAKDAAGTVPRCNLSVPTSLQCPASKAEWDCRQTTIDRPQECWGLYAYDSVLCRRALPFPLVQTFPSAVELVGWSQAKHENRNQDDQTAYLVQQFIGDHKIVSEGLLFQLVEIVCEHLS